MATPTTGESAAQPVFLERGLAALPLLVPGLAGLAYLVLFGAPSSYLAINALALAGGSLWAAFGSLPARVSRVRALLAALLALLALPLIAGPSVDGIARWLSLGGFTLNVGLLAVPLIAVQSAQEPKFAPLCLLVATLIAFAQPDAAAALALSFAALASWKASRDWRAGAVGALGLFASAGAALSGNLPPQPFVEGVLTDLARTAPLMAALLGFSLIASLTLILRAPSPRTTRWPLAGALTGFALAALLGDYPAPLIGYGAASILGLGLALPALGKPL